MLVFFTAMESYCRYKVHVSRVDQPIFNQRGFPHESVSVESKTEGAYALSAADIF